MKISIFDTHTKLMGAHTGAKVFKIVDNIVENHKEKIFEEFVEVRNNEQMRAFMEKFIYSHRMELAHSGLGMSDQLTLTLVSLSWLNYLSHRGMVDFGKIGNVEGNWGNFLASVYSSKVLTPLYYIVNWYHTVYFDDESDYYTGRDKMFLYSLVLIWKEDKSLFEDLIDYTIGNLGASCSSAGGEYYYIKEGITGIHHNPGSIFMSYFLSSEVLESMGRLEKKDSDFNKDSIYSEYLLDAALKGVAGNLESVVGFYQEAMYDYCKYKFFFGGRFEQLATSESLRLIRPLLDSLNPISKDIIEEETLFEKVPIEDYVGADKMTRELIAFGYQTRFCDSPWEATDIGISVRDFSYSISEQIKPYCAVICSRVRRMNLNDVVEKIMDEGLTPSLF